MRSRKLKKVARRIGEYAAAIEAAPASCAGSWAARHLPGAREVRLDLGCGKGSFALRAAAAEPDVLVVGVDCEEGCVATAAKRALAQGAPNAVFAVGDADALDKLFGPGELSLIYLNFCTPFTPAKQARRRLTHVDRLMGYRALLAPGGRVRFKTDSRPLFEFSKIQFGLAGYRTLWETEDLHAFNPDELQSDYEELLTAKGARICALLAEPGPAPASWEQTAPLGLASYLPEDLDSLDYIPYGMEPTVENLRNQRANAEAKARRAAARAEKRAGA